MMHRREIRVEKLAPEVIQALRARTAGERIQMAYDSNRLVRERIRAHLTHVHSDWSVEQVEQEIAKRVLRGTG